MACRVSLLLLVVMFNLSFTVKAVDLRHTLLKQQVLKHQTELSKAVFEHYKNNDYAYIWIKDQKLLPNAFSLFTYLTNAKKMGLDVNDYFLAEIRKRWGEKDSLIQAELEVFLTRAFERYIIHLINGRWIAQEVDDQWHINSTPLDVEKILSLLKTDDLSVVIAEHKINHSGYKMLLAQLLFYQELADKGGWPTIESGPVLVKGSRDEQVETIRLRLRMTKDLVSGTSENIDKVDSVLEHAVMYFQARHGLKIDGKVGSQTRAIMNIPVEQRIRQIKINLNRWRWLPRNLGQRYLLVNLTGFELYAEENGKPVLSMPIIIGKHFRETPSFSSRLSYLEINPYWTVPKSIALKDLIPRQMRDSGYFNRNKIKVLNGWKKDAEEVDISTVSLRRLNENYFPYTFRQEPGPLNSLGRVKFMFPNPYDIYLHDTPKRYLFDRRVRAFSSGCIRVKDPLRLSAYLLDSPTQQKEEEMMQLISRGENSGMSLVKAVPIYLVYWTAWTDQDGRLNFRDDLYGRDKIMLKMLK